MNRFYQTALATMQSGGGGAAAPFALKGVQLWEGTGNGIDASTPPRGLPLPGDPQAGDLAIMLCSGAGGVTNHFLPSTPAGWTAISSRPSSGHTLWKILDEGETTGPTQWTNVSADWHVYAAVFSGAVFDSGVWGTVQDGPAVLTGSNQSIRRLNDLVVPVDSFLVYAAFGASGSSAYALTPTTTFTPVVDTLLFDGRQVTFGHAAAGSVVEGNGVSTDYDYGNLGATFNFNSTSAYRGAYAIVSAA